jgi:hypothetical protein
MKKKNFSKKLSLNRQTISHLNTKNMKNLNAGGLKPPDPYLTIDDPTCFGWSCDPGCTDSACATQCTSGQCC